MNKVSIERLLEQNPDVRRVFEENAKKLGSRRNVDRKGSGYSLGLPYGGNGLRRSDWNETPSPVTASYQKF